MLRTLWIAPASWLALGCAWESGNPGASARAATGGASSGSGTGGASAGAEMTGFDMRAAAELTQSSCAELKVEPEVLPAVLELVVDTSASMSLTSPATQGKSKWSVTREALREAIAELPASTAVGMLYYPNMPTLASSSPRDISACVNVDTRIPVHLLGEAGSTQRRFIENSLDRAKPNGATPTHDAYEYALATGLTPSTLPGERYMLVITDGAPTLALGCVGPGVPDAPQPTQPIIDEILGARVNHGIRTFLIGSPGSEDNGAGGDMRPWLSTAAVLGGTAIPGCSVEGPNYCHVDLVEVSDFAAALRARLTEIVGQIVACAYELPNAPNGQAVETSEVNVIYSPGGGGEPLLVGQNPDANCYFGWQLRGNTLALCGQTCDVIRKDPGAKLELLFGCATQRVPSR